MRGTATSGRRVERARTDADRPGESARRRLRRPTAGSKQIRLSAKEQTAAAPPRKSARFTSRFLGSGASRRARTRTRRQTHPRPMAGVSRPTCGLSCNPVSPFCKKVRRRKIVHEGKRQHEGEHDAHAARVDADRVAREVLFERHHDPAQRVDADEPERDRRDGQRDAEIDQRAADNDERNEDHENPVDVHAGGDRGEGERSRAPTRSRRA